MPRSRQTRRRHSARATAESMFTADRASRARCLLGDKIAQRASRGAPPAWRARVVDEHVDARRRRRSPRRPAYLRGVAKVRRITATCVATSSRPTSTAGRRGGGQALRPASAEARSGLCGRALSGQYGRCLPRINAALEIEHPLVLEVQDRVVIVDGGAQQMVGIVRRSRHHELEAWHVDASVAPRCRVTSESRLSCAFLLFPSVRIIDLPQKLFDGRCLPAELCVRGTRRMPSVRLGSPFGPNRWASDGDDVRPTRLGMQRRDDVCAPLEHAALIDVALVGDLARVKIRRFRQQQ